MVFGKNCIIQSSTVLDSRVKDGQTDKHNSAQLKHYAVALTSLVMSFKKYNAARVPYCGICGPYDTSSRAPDMNDGSELLHQQLHATRTAATTKSYDVAY